ncbi:MAG: NfeD family protein [Synechococcales cyanobacterium RM1_1_8]|nr:NfeD family protein [Synechococcales cyanobacterium RM1_1_8]
MVIPQLWIQGVIWLALSTLLLFGFRRLSRSRRDRTWQMNDWVATTLTSIPAGATGRVQYEGGSWQARAYDPGLEIAAHQTVHVVEQQGNTLIVMPQSPERIVLPGE